MRFKINAKLKQGNTFPINFRSKILRILKKGMSNGDDGIFKDFFGVSRQKNYTWSVYFYNVKFETEEIRFLDEKKKIYN